MDIPALSMAMAQTNVMNDIGIAMLDKALDLNENLGEEFVAALDHSMELSVNPHIGSNFDVFV